MDFTFHLPTRIHFGRGKLDQLGELTRPWGSRALIVCGTQAMRRTGALSRACTALIAADVRTEVFDGISANPRSDEVDQAVKQARATGIEVIIGMGGGSALDAAKAAAVGIAHESVGPLVGHTLQPSTDSLPVIAVPTTAGSGAEVTRGAILTDTARGIKSGIRGEDLFPRVAVVDPSLTDSMPRAVALAAGFDALAHAVEGLVARRSGPLNRQLAEHAFRVIPTALVQTANSRAGSATRDALAYAALLGGINVATASTCLPHRMQQAMTTTTHPGPSHGQGLAILYPAWLESLATRIPTAYAELSAAFPGGDALCEISQLLTETQLATTLSGIGYQPEDIPRFTDRVTGNTDNDPHPDVTPELITELYTSCL
jgi:alcohol dehydrogenase class IV